MRGTCKRPQPLTQLLAQETGVPAVREAPMHASSRLGALTLLDAPGPTAKRVQQLFESLLQR